MIESVTVTNPKNESLHLVLREPNETTGLYIENVEGLGPPKANINSTELATIDGALFSSSRITERNIIITLGMLLPNVEDARLKTYKYFPIKKEVKLRIKTKNRDAEIVGYVESHEPVIFSKQEKTQISILCPDPFFYEIRDDEIVFSNIRPLFEFPFSNESLTENLIEFGQIHLDRRAIVNYIGDVDIGMLITIHCLGETNNITIFNVDTHEQLKINTDRIASLTGKPFSIGDSIVINTVRGYRYARLLREGLYINIISAIDKTSDWFQLSNGDNVFTFTTDTEENNILITLLYNNAYGGV